MIEVHPLHSFDARYFKEGSDLFSFDTVALESAKTRANRASFKKIKMNGGVKNKKVEKISLESLERFLKSPAEAFFREGLQLKMDEIQGDSEGEESGQIERYALMRFDQEILKNTALSEVDSEFLADFVKTQTFSGHWPKGVYGEIALEALKDRGHRVLELSRQINLGKRCDPLRLEENLFGVEISSPTLITGILPAFFEKGFMSVVDTKTPRLKHHRNAWLRYLLLRHRDQDNRFAQMTSVIVSAHWDGKVSELQFTLSLEEAQNILRGLLETFLLNLEEVIPIYFECCEAVHRKKTEDLSEKFEEAIAWCEYSLLYFKTPPDFEEETLFLRLENFTRLFYGTFFSEKWGLGKLL